MARKKKDEPGKSILLPTAKKHDENPWVMDDWDEDEDEDEDEDDWDEDDEMDEMSQELFNALMGRLIHGNENSGGMTNEQYKGMLLDQLEIWKRVKRTADEENAKKTSSECQMQIALINKKLKL